MYNPIEKERQAIISNITKGFIDNDIEKARHGVYSDNAENRRLKRVGQEYGSAASHQYLQQDHSNNEGGKDLSSYASKTKTEVLQKVVDSNTASKELKDAASKELKERNGNDNTAKDSASKQSNRQEKSIGKYGVLVTNNNHSYIKGDTHYGDTKKADFINQVKEYLKSKGESYDPSKLSVEKKIGYDHYHHPYYTYTLSGNREEEEKMHDEHMAKKQKEMDNKVAEWKKKNKTAEEILGSRASVFEAIQDHATDDEKAKMREADDLEYVKIKAKIAQRIKEEKSKIE